MEFYLEKAIFTDRVSWFFMREAFNAFQSWRMAALTPAPASSFRWNSSLENSLSSRDLLSESETSNAFDSSKMLIFRVPVPSTDLHQTWEFLQRKLLGRSIPQSQNQDLVENPLAQGLPSPIETWIRLYVYKIIKLSHGEVLLVVDFLSPPVYATVPL